MPLSLHVKFGLAVAAAVMLAAASAAAAPRPLVIAIGALPGGRGNPHHSISMVQAWLMAAVHDSLTFVDRDGRLTPWLASGWRREDPNTWLFDLRPDVRFSNGSLFTARDVVRNIDYLKGTDGQGEATAPYVASVAAVEARADHLVAFRTKAPDPVLPQKLSLIRIAALPGGGGFTRDRLIREAIGTGPYRIATWGAGRATMTANSDAWRRAPTAELHAIAMPDSTARRNAIVTGIADIAFAAFFFEDVGKPGLGYSLEADAIPAVVALAFNTKHATPLGDPRVRRALAHAVDAKTIIDALFAGHAALASQPARREFLGFNPEVARPDYDPARARALLADAGVPNGFSFTMSLTSGATVWDQVFELIASDLAKVGVRMNIVMIPNAAFNEQLTLSGIKDDAYAAVYFAPTFDALDALRLHSCASPVAVYCDREAQALIDQAQAAPDLDARTALARRAMARAADMQQAIFLYESVGLVGYSKRISGLRSDFGFIRYELMTVQD